MKAKQFFRQVLESVRIDPRRLVDALLGTFADLLIKFSKWLEKFSGLFAWWVKSVIDSMYDETGSRVRDNGWRIGSVHLSPGRNHALRHVPID